MKIKLLIGLMAICGIANAQTITAGGYHSLAICNDKTVKSWGRNLYGQLGNGTLTSSNVPVSVNSLTGIISVAGGLFHSLALKNDGTVWAWGFNDDGQLGNGSITSSNVPVQVYSLTGITIISSGYNHCLALKNDGTVWAWGDNDYAQLGNGTDTGSYVPIQVNSLTGIIAIAAGKFHSLALKNDGTVWAWGWNADGQLGNGTDTGSYVPIQVDSLTGITAIAAGGAHSLALKNDGTEWAWGNDYDGELGNGNYNTGSLIPVQVYYLTGITAIAGGDKHSIALKNNGTVWTWGDGSVGQLGNGFSIGSGIPLQVSAFTDVNMIAIAGGNAHSIVLKNDGTVWTMGDNEYGQLGTGNNNDSGYPVQVTGLCPMLSVNEITEQQSVSLFPNPFSTETTLQTDMFLKNATITMVNYIGQTVKNIKNISGQTFIISRDNLPCGLYFIRLLEENKTIATGKLVINDK